MNLAITEGVPNPVGAVGLDIVDAVAGTGQVGYWVARVARGRGLATRAATLVGDLTPELRDGLGKRRAGRRRRLGG